jgi:predicted DNA-binding transcriptional regulator AlpA
MCGGAAAAKVLGKLMGRSIQRESEGTVDDSASRLSAKLLTPAELAEITGLSQETLAQWRSQKRGIPYVKISHNCVRYRPQDVDLWIDQRIVRVDVDQSR